MKGRVRKLLLGIGMSCAAAATIPNASAADQGWYVGIGVGQSRFDASASDLDSALNSQGATTTGTTLDDTDTGWKLFGGYNFNKNFALEGGFVDLGKLNFSTTLTAPVAGGLSGEIKAENGFYFDAVGILPVSPNFNVYGKVGVYSIKAKLSGSVTGASFGGSDRESDLTYGVGASFDFNKNVGIRAEWERFRDVGDASKTGEGDVDLVSVGVTWKFP